MIHHHFVRRRSHCGISLLEVLVSIFILSVGLLGVAALIPIGNSQVIKGAIAHRGSELGERVYREIRLRGWLRTDMWLRADGSPAVEEKTGQLVQGLFDRAVAIDPYTAAVSPGTTIFPRNSQTPMPLLTFKQAPDQPQKMSLQLAKLISVSSDNLVFQRPSDGNRPAIQRLNRTGTKRLSESLYSWMMTLSPVPNDRGTYLLSVVVFYRDAPSESDGQPRDSQNLDNIQPLGGGEYKISGSVEAMEIKDYLRPGRWMMLSDGQNQYRWFRIVAVSGVGRDKQTKREIALAGSEFPLSSTLSATVFRGVVGVYEKRVQLEQPTFWLPADDGPLRRFSPVR